MFKTRLLSGIVLMIVTIALMVYGGMPLFIAITLISLIGLFELYRTVKAEKSLPAFICYLASIIIDVLILDNYDLLFIYAMAITLILVLACYVTAFPKFDSEQITMMIFGLIYVTAFLSCIFKVRFLENGIITVWLIFICSWGSDTCAYCVGRLLGKHHLPKGFGKLSPKKTIEGCVGGIVGAALIGVIFAAIVYKTSEMIVTYLIISACGAVISEIGDLAASAIKRNHDIKDYGNLIPGHGGILDRFDSVIFTAPVVYLLTMALGK
ncbi:MAG: phosphatidate cytidylyltransferase [Lachnospiraceae bacterium]|jgi:phosphatidate cytidylyltransferase|nr:phosphatidate cytidylyltransferase [Lachnospiraceae bacterium]MEE3461842.1 phosphatidate cytidylyltransferase [Lachnospiraceae bacterium]